MNKIIIVFHSTRDAINAERMCLRSGLRCQAVPVPRHITADCGIALEVDIEDRNAAEALLKKENIAAVCHGG
jgi:hypothetical protein